MQFMQESNLLNAPNKVRFLYVQKWYFTESLNGFSTIKTFTF